MFAIDEQTLLSGRFDRYFRYAAWIEIAVFFTGLFMLFCYYLTLIGETTPLQHLSLRILLAAIGAAGALGGTLLSKGMWAYWKHCDANSKKSKKIWFSAMTFVPLFGCAAYYFVVYRSQVGRRRLETPCP